MAAAKKSTTELSGLDRALAELNKAGKIQIARGSDAPPPDIDRISTGIMELDSKIGGGIPRGRITEVFGKEACLTGETFIQYSVLSSGEKGNHKGGTLERLYYRFNKIPIPGKGNYHRAITADAEFRAPSVNEQGRIFKNPIEGVFKTGLKPVYLLTTDSGRTIKATTEHKFFTGSRYVPLSDLNPGDTVMVHNKTPFTVEIPADKRATGYRKDWYVKDHPVCGKKTIRENGNTYTYSRLAQARGIVEAEMNGLSPSEYRARLNTGNLEGLVTLPRDQHVHHRDEDFTNDSLSNLVVLSDSEHTREHAIERHNNLRFIAVEEKIISIEFLGEEETYDVRMKSPFNNYVANGFVVHNSGKTTIALQVASQAQKMGLTVAYFDMEQTLNPEYMKTLGVDWDALILSQPDTAEQVFEAMDKIVASGEVGLVVVDSVAAMPTRQEFEGDYGDANVGSKGRIMAQGLRKLNPMLLPTNTAVIFINQLTANIGGYSPMGAPPDITTGGRALKFYASLRLEIVRTGAFKSGEEVIGATTKAKAIKNKTFPPYKEANFNIIYGKGVTRGASIIDTAVDAGAIKRSGAWYTDTEGESLGQGKPAVIDLLDTDDVLYARILSEVEGK